jgi:hypothetical protein
MSWFPDQQACAQWGGPAMRFPFTEERFLEDIHWGKMPSYSAVSDEFGLLGFGQLKAAVNLSQCQVPVQQKP